MTDEVELIHSPLTQIYEADGYRLQIQIYRLSNTLWSLEVVDENGTSTVWDELFDTDKAALERAFLDIEKDGAAQFVEEALQEAKAAGPEVLRKLAQLNHASDDLAQRKQPHLPDLAAPLSDAELQELEQLLLELDSEEGMLLEMLDGFLYAIAIGPELVMPSQWLPMVWGEEDAGVMPPVESKEAAQHLLGLIMRHYNSIISGFEQTPRLATPIWGATEYAIGTFEDAEIWAHGFCEGVNLSRAAWQPLLDDLQGKRCYLPIGLLGEAELSPEQNKLIRTPAQRQALAQQIPEALLNMHAFWLPHRYAMNLPSQAPHISTKVGRNEPCPCGSGRKFKKCCGGAGEPH